MTDLLVVGLDLGTGQEVHVGDREIWEWHRKGHNGDRTLVCKECYEGADPPGGPRTVALVPRGRLGGVRRGHFAHPPGMAPPGGRHSPESLWHSRAKLRFRRWAQGLGASAQVEAYTPEGRRRSDVAITLADGTRLAIEVQAGAITDAEWLDRHEDYARAGIIDVWVWNPWTWVPRLLYTHGQQGWVLNLDKDEIGFIYAQPRHMAGSPGRRHTGECGDVHWPPCPGDPQGTLWMPLRSMRLTAEGLELPVGAKTQIHQRVDLTRNAQALRRRIEAPATASPRGIQAVQGPPAPAGAAADEQNSQRVPEVHAAFQYDAFPPWTAPDTWWYYCDTCGRRLLGAEIRTSAIVHVVPTTGSITGSGRLLTVYTRYGGTTVRTVEDRSAAPGG